MKNKPWCALTVTRLEEAFYAMMLWGGLPLKVIEDASAMAAKRRG